MQTPAGCHLLLSAFVWSVPGRLSGNVYKNVQVANITYHKVKSLVILFTPTFSFHRSCFPMNS